jgi:very-short-patch-repair endonuclease
MNAAIDKGWRPEAPPLQGRGLGWGLSHAQLAELHARAAEMRCNPTKAEKKLWFHLSASQLGGHKFCRQSVIGWYIADFLCPAKALIVEVDGNTHDEAKDRIRDDRLAEFGFRVLRVTNENVLTAMEAVLALIAEALLGASDRWPNNPHPNPSPEGEGLKEAQKLLGISLEGSVG